ncbi:MAG TPA: DMT family transporter [Deltaproteobacteria bacterium]|nr:DMT family transporter [Deltaproteobacteria bacterium]
MTLRKANILLILAAVSWSSGGLFIKLLPWNPFSILCGRSILAALVVLVYLRRPSIDRTGIQIIGGIGYVGAQLFFILGTQMTAAANAIFLHYTSPLYVFLFSYWLLKERSQPADWMSMAVILLGMLLFLGDGLTVGGLMGNMFGALSGIAIAAVVLCSRRQKSGEPANMILLGNLMSIAVGFPFLIQETFTLRTVGIILFLGIIQMGLSYVLFSMAIKHLKAMEAIIIMALEPILNPIWVFIVIGEVPGLLAIFGAVMVLGAVTGRSIISARRTADERVLDG